MYDDTLIQHGIFFVMRLREISKNFIEVKLNFFLIRRQVEFICHLMRYREYKSKGASSEMSYHNNCIDSFIKSDKVKSVEGFIDKNPFYFKENNDNTTYFEQTEVDSIVEYLYIYCEKEKELIKDALDESISPSVRHYFLILISIKDILFSMYFKIKFFNGKKKLSVHSSDSKSEYNNFFKMIYELIKNNNRLSFIASDLFLQLLTKDKDPLS